MLEIKNLRVVRGENQVIDALNLEVGENEIVGLLGHSGCGKSSLLYTVSGLLPIQSGSIKWQGNEISTPKYALAPNKRNFGLVFQDHLLFPHKNVFQNLAFGLKSVKGADRFSKTQIANRVFELLEILNLKGFEKRPIQSLSGGQAQRVSLGRALATKPKLLLLDEPLAALDQTLRESLSAELCEIIKSQKIPALYVTHDLQEAFFVSDRLAIMGDGTIHSIGRPEELRNRPPDSYTASFLGLHNQFKVEIGEGGELICPFGVYEHKHHKLPLDTKKILIMPEGVEIFDSTSDGVALSENLKNDGVLGSGEGLTNDGGLKRDGVLGEKMKESEVLSEKGYRILKGSVTAIKFSGMQYIAQISLQAQIPFQDQDQDQDQDQGNQQNNLVDSQDSPIGLQNNSINLQIATHKHLKIGKEYKIALDPMSFLPLL